MPLLVEDGHDHGNGGEPHVGIGVHRRLTLPRTGDTGARAGGRWAGPQIVSAYGAQDPRTAVVRRCPLAHAAAVPPAPHHAPAPAATRPRRPATARPPQGALGDAGRL